MHVQNFMQYIIGVLCLSLAVCVSAGEHNVLFREEFNDLSNWRALTFPKIEKQTSYRIGREKEGTYLHALSNASASAILYKERINVYDFPKVKWRWKITTVYKSGEAGTKAGDDFPIRIYIMFPYDPANAGLGERIKYSLVKKLYGKYPPHSSLNYIWANHGHSDRIITSPYTNRVKMIVLEAGTENAGTWVNETINILEDYKDAFGLPPPKTARIAVMNDSDNTLEQSVSYIDFIEVFR
jgi:hypothetical protein